MLPQASQARKAIWEAVNPHTGKRRIDEAFPPAIRSVTRENEMFIRFVNGSTWQLVGSDNYNSLVGSPPAGVVFSEWALADPSSWAFLAPILRENGGWALFITTPRGQNHAGRMYDSVARDPQWFAETLTADQTGVFSPEDLAQERIELMRVHGEQVGASIFEQEYYCSFASAVVGQVYAGELRALEAAGRITRVPYEPLKPVQTFWDLGYSDHTAIWFAQRVGLETRIVDCLSGSQRAVHDYLREMQTKGYVYSTDWLPHDARAKSLGTGKSIEEVLREAGRTVQIVPQLSIAEGINAARALFPSCWFDAERCEPGLNALRNYRYDVKEGQFSKNPAHDWASHFSDAWRYLAVAIDSEQPKMPLTHAPAIMPYLGGAPTGWMA